MFNGATVHGITGTHRLRHPAEIPLLVVAVLTTLMGYGAWFIIISWLASSSEATGMEAEVRRLFLDGGTFSQVLLVIPLVPLIVWIVRAIMYARLRASSVQMSPTQFPEGYRMVVEAAQEFGLRRVPDAYVVLGNGQINAFASGHGFRRFVAVYSDLFEIGGKARDPEALRFIIGHEVGHLAAGHVSYFRLIFSQLVSYVPLLGQAFSRAQEYTADNHGYAHAPDGVPGAMGVLSGGKYLGAEVNTHALADRATREKGFWLHMSNWLSTHPINTWRAHALRDRRRPRQRMVRLLADAAADALGAELHHHECAQRGAVRPLPGRELPDSPQRVALGLPSSGSDHPDAAEWATGTGRARGTDPHGSRPPAAGNSHYGH